ncbi:hypothetical protein [Shewanella carassii]|uniref:Uncharacterized protein n=1 Tax=Shewanella carassii TaxID=1987584 RepID=A0ABQ1T1B2_9GAMM|nr:hypothetical protein [Shewanella carassii]GGE74300.1 hypothetical protein GCM10011520_13560 [Shewanella carassii]
MSVREESIGSQFVHVVLPTVVVLIIAGISFSADLCISDEFFWFQRSGALIAAAGIYTAFHENGKRYELEGSTLNINSKIWYQWLALTLGILGTFIWAYGDLPFR